MILSKIEYDSLKDLAISINAELARVEDAHYTLRSTYQSWVTLLYKILKECKPVD